MISVPSSSSASLRSALTEACVPTGMKNGVSVIAVRRVEVLVLQLQRKSRQSKRTTQMDAQRNNGNIKEHAKRRPLLAPEGAKKSLADERNPNGVEDGRDCHYDRDVNDEK